MTSSEVQQYAGDRAPAPVAHLSSVELPPARELTAMERTADFRTWAERLGAASQIASVVARTEFVPKALRGNEAAVTAAIMAGAEMNLAPMTSLNHVYIIEGRPSLSAEMGRALVLAHGHEIEWRETTTERAVVAGRRRNEKDWTVVTWTMDDARRAKLAGKDVWQKHPRRMLAARASSELNRLKFGDAMAGMAYSAEELQDDADDAGAVIDGPAGEGPAETAQRSRTPRATSTRRRAQQPDPQPSAERAASGPPLPGEDERPSPPASPPARPGQQQQRGNQQRGASTEVRTEPEKAPDTPATVTKNQLGKIGALFTEAKVTDRSARLRVCASMADRAIESSTELTQAEASSLIDHLQELGPDGVAALADPGNAAAPATEGEQGQLGEQEPVDAEVVEEQTDGEQGGQS